MAEVLRRTGARMVACPRDGWPSHLPGASSALPHGPLSPFSLPPRPIPIPILVILVSADVLRHSPPPSRRRHQQRRPQPPSSQPPHCPLPSLPLPRPPLTTSSSGCAAPAPSPAASNARWPLAPPRFRPISPRPRFPPRQQRPMPRRLPPPLVRAHQPRLALRLIPPRSMAMARCRVHRVGRGGIRT